MEDYDNMASGRIVPFAMLSGPTNYTSKTINTDRHGFRLTNFNGQYLSIDDISNFEKINLIIGGSTVFGVGASSDDSTISSLLSKETNDPWFSLGIRGGVSLQEYIHLIRFINKARKIDNIVFFSGINDVYINLLTDQKKDFDNRFESDDTQHSCKRRIISYILSKIYFIDQSKLINKPLTEMLFNPYKNHEKDTSREVLTDDERINVLFENLDRNFLLYSAIKEKIDCRMYYILQPFAYWTGKSITEEERQVFDYLDQLQKKSKWASQKSKFTLDIYQRVKNYMKNLATQYNVIFIDSNKYFNVNKTLFVDSVHLNDDGNVITKNIILESIKEGMKYEKNN